jgi:Flp pilus assembly protein TadG
VKERGIALSDRMRRCVRRLQSTRLRRDEEGAVAIEFAIIAPVFFFLMFVIAQTALVFIAEQVLDNAVFTTARLIRTGQAQAADMSKQDFKNNVCSRASVFLDCDSGDFYLDVKSYPSFQSMTFNNPVKPDNTFQEAGDFDYGGASEIVVVRAYYQWPVNSILGQQWRNLLGNGKLLIGSFAAFRNEPFTATASAE